MRMMMRTMIIFSDMHNDEYGGNFPLNLPFLPLSPPFLHCVILADHCSTSWPPQSSLSSPLLSLDQYWWWKNIPYDIVMGSCMALVEGLGEKTIMKPSKHSWNLSMVVSYNLTAPTRWSSCWWCCLVVENVDCYWDSSYMIFSKNMKINN